MASVANTARRRFLLGLATGAFLGLAAGIIVMIARPSAHADAQASPAQPGPVDVGFAQFMTVHHDQAVLMSQIMLEAGTGTLQALARTIQMAQLLEMGQLRGWLTLWGKPLLPATRSMDWMLAGPTPPAPELSRYLLDCKSSSTGMPGLATAQEIDQLRQDNIEDRDHRFLQLMIRHHQGALPMARFAAANAQIAAVRTLAAQIVFDQTGELYRMTRLQEHGGLDTNSTDTGPVASTTSRPGSEIRFPCQLRKPIGNAFPGCKRANLGQSESH